MADRSDVELSPLEGWDPSGNYDDLWPEENAEDLERVSPATLGILGSLAIAALIATVGTIIVAVH